MEYSNLLLEKNGSILRIIINREQKLNALNQATLTELGQAFQIAYNDASIRGVILTGSGTKAFAAGADIAEFQKISAAQGASLARDVQQTVFNLIENCPKPVIAAINGYALGGGLELALACHIRLAADSAKMALPELTLGLIPGYGGTQRLPQLVGKGKAFELILSSEMLSAATALEIGLVNYVTIQSELLIKAEEILTKILKNPSSAISSAIKAINSSSNTTGFEVEIEEFGKCFETEEGKEGISAFLEKRKPNF